MPKTQDNNHATTPQQTANTDSPEFSMLLHSQLLEAYNKDTGKLKPANERLDEATYLLCNVSAILKLIAEHGEQYKSKSALQYSSACELLTRVVDIATCELVEIQAAEDDDDE